MYEVCFLETLLVWWSWYLASGYSHNVLVVSQSQTYDQFVNHVAKAECEPVLVVGESVAMLIKVTVTDCTYPQMTESAVSGRGDTCYLIHTHDLYAHVGTGRQSQQHVLTLSSVCATSRIWCISHFQIHLRTLPARTGGWCLQRLRSTSASHLAATFFLSQDIIRAVAVVFTGIGL